MLDTTITEVDPAIGEGRHRGIVSHENQGRSFACPHLGEEIENHPAGRAIEIARGFIGEQQRRFGSESAGESDPLLLPTRKLRRVVVAPFGQPDGFEQLVGPFSRIRSSEEFHGEHDVLPCGEVAQQLERLENKTDGVAPHQSEPVFGQTVDALTPDRDFAGARTVEPGHEGEQGRFSAARWTEHGDKLTLGDIEIDGVENRQHLPARGQLAPDAAQREQFRFIHRCGHSVPSSQRYNYLMMQIISSRHRLALLATLSVLIIGCGTPPPSAPQPASPTVVPIVQVESEFRIVVLGDSLAAGLGLAEAEAFPAVAESLLRAEGFDVTIVNAGVSGDTTAGGLSRIDWVLQRPAEILVVELGGNDALRGQPLDNTEKNLREIVSRGRESGAEVVLLGMDVPTNYGPDYASGFADLYLRVADEEGALLIPGFVREVGADPTLLQPDGLHPTAEGQRLLARTLHPFLLEILESRVSSSKPL